MPRMKNKMQNKKLMSTTMVEYPLGTTVKKKL
jgi:hypothetical protein